MKTQGFLIRFLDSWLSNCMTWAWVISAARATKVRCRRRPKPSNTSLSSGFRVFRVFTLNHSGDPTMIENLFLN